MGYSPQGRKELDATERLHLHLCLFTCMLIYGRIVWMLNLYKGHWIVSLMLLNFPPTLNIKNIYMLLYAHICDFII